MLHRAPVPFLLNVVSVLAVVSVFVPNGIAQRPRNVDPTDHEMFAAYWTAEAGWHSELQMRNNFLAGDLTVVPVLRGPDGTEFPLPPVTIAPNEIKSVDVSDAITKSAAPLAGSYGSVVFRYHSKTGRNLYAAVMLLDSGHPIAFHLDAFPESKEYDTGSREGIWWLPNATAKDFLVLTNEGRNPLQTSLSIYDASGKSSVQQLTLKPRTVTRYSIRDLTQKAGIGGQYGGIKIDVKANVGSLDTTHVIFDEEAGFSALMKMFDRDPNGQIEQRFGFPEEKTWTTRAPMLALTNPDPSLQFPPDTVLQPKIFVRNATANPVTASTRFNWRSDTKTGSAAGPTLTLRPYETQLVDVSALQSNQTIPADAHWASVEVSSSCQPDDIVAVAASYDATLRYGTQTPFSDQLTFKWVGGEWQVDATHNSITTAGNGGKEALKAQFTIYYDQGKNRYDLQQDLKPHEQMWVDIGNLIHNAVPDKNGSVLPADLMMGSYEFRDLTDPLVGSLYEGKVILDKTYGHVAYGCAYCCGFDGAPYMYWDPIGPPIQSFLGQDIWDTESCAGYEGSVLDDYMNSGWTTGNSAIATASYANITGVSPGQTTNGAQGTERTGGYDIRLCRNRTFHPSGPVNVLQISQDALLWYFNGNPTPPGFTLGSVTANLTASGGGGGTYAWTITKGTSIAALQGTTSGQNVTTVQIASTSYSTTANDVTVQLQFEPTSGTQSVQTTYSLSVDSPYKLISNGTTTNRGVQAPCTSVPAPSGSAGFQSLVPYAVISFFGVQISKIGVFENFSNIQTVYNGNNWQGYAAGGTTTPDGTFVDDICAVGQTVPPSLPPQSPLSNVQIDQAFQTWNVGSGSAGAGLPVQTDTIRRYQDHGTHAGITSPVR